MTTESWRLLMGWHFTAEEVIAELGLQNAEWRKSKRWVAMRPAQNKPAKGRVHLKHEKLTGLELIP